MVMDSSTFYLWVVPTVSYPDFPVIQVPLWQSGAAADPGQAAAGRGWDEDPETGQGVPDVPRTTEQQARSPTAVRDKSPDAGEGETLTGWKLGLGKGTNWFGTLNAHSNLVYWNWSDTVKEERP